MKTSKYIILLHKKLSGEIEPNEQQALDQWLETQPDRQLADDTEQAWDWTGRYKSAYEPDVKQGLTRFKSKLQEERAAEKPALKTAFLRPSRWAAAAALLMLVAGVWWWLGHGAATTGEEMYATQASETRTVKLPDGSAVTMNESSQLTFVVEGNERKAIFSGEAYFAIASDPDRPFSISAGGTNTQVVGTAFNLRAYPEEPTVEVEVEEGVVQLKGPDNNDMIELTAKERGICRPRLGKLYKVSADDLNALAWHTNELQFTAESFGRALPEMERFFRIDLELENEELADCVYNGTFKIRSAEQLLENLELIFGFEINKVGKRMYRLEGGRCR